MQRNEFNYNLWKKVEIKYELSRISLEGKKLMIRSAWWWLDTSFSRTNQYSIKKNNPW